MSSRGLARRLTSALLLASVALAAASTLGCGKKGPPLPPLRFVPAPTKDLAIEQRGTQVLLTFTYPQTTPSGAALNGVTSVEVWELVRLVPPRPPAPPPPPAAAGTLPAAPATPAAPKTAATAPTAATLSATTAPPTSTPPPAAQSTTPPPPAPAARAPAPAAPTAPGGAAAPSVPPTPAVGAATVPPPPADLPGGFPAVDPRELAGQAKLKLKLQGAEIATATLGDKVVIAIPAPEPLPPAAGTPAGTPEAAAKAPASSPVTSSATGAKPAAGTPATTAPAAGSEQVHYYVVRTTGPKNDRSAFSNQVALVPKVPPSPPGEVKLKGTAEGIEVAWTDPAPPPPAGARPIPGFNVFRRDAKAKGFGPPLRAAIGSARSVVDNTARFGESYIYSVTTIAEPNPLVESAIKSEVEVKYVDRFPPPAPSEVVALAEAGAVRVVWRAAVAPDLAGYLVYRRQGAAGPFQKLTAAPISDLQYLDGAVATGATYTYRVTAVDQSGNESAPGEAQTKVQ